ncbi:carboxylesterase family protein [Actinoallomurus sp. NPDC052308]|uniref:carboxylesterase/lipase family protein n=1 Tax=Actinoallomurus sp. NPDC052308 TaxID=3155530 RepID=UPI00342B7042
MTKRRIFRNTVRIGATASAGLLAAGLAAAPALAETDTADGRLVRTASGPVLGSVGTDVREFNGIPYAAPPVGSLRWTAPRPVAAWSSPRDATKPGPVCAQSPYNKPVGSTVSEDCLTVNVTTPRDASAAHKKPVMVFLHGGDLTTGSGSQFEPRRMAAQGDVVVVTVNYRLGIFGFFGHAGLPGSGTFGLQDQQAALRWIRRNAAAFGGDASNVTLFGQSAGAISTCGQLTSPAAKGLYDKVVIQSASCGSYTPTLMLGQQAPTTTATTKWKPLAEVDAQGGELAKELGCADAATAIDCLRGLPTDRLLPHTEEFSSGAYGTPTLPQNPEAAIRAGRFNRVPTIIGHTRDEGRMVTASLVNPAYGGTPMTEQRYVQLTDQAYGAKAADVRRHYPPSAYAAAGEQWAPALAWAAIETDRTTVCPVLRDADALARRTPVHAYEFADPNAPTWTAFPEGFPAGASHISDLTYLFDVNRPDGTPVTLDAAQRALAGKMIAYWTAFAHSGAPAADGAPAWAAYASGTRHVQTLAPARIGSVDDATEHQCAFWNTAE